MQLAGFTLRAVSTIFSDARHFRVHDPLPSGHHLGDEGDWAFQREKGLAWLRLLCLSGAGDRDLVGA